MTSEDWFTLRTSILQVWRFFVHSRHYHFPNRQLFPLGGWISTQSNWPIMVSRHYLRMHDISTKDIFLNFSPLHSVTRLIRDIWHCTKFAWVRESYAFQHGFWLVAWLPERGFVGGGMRAYMHLIRDRTRTQSFFPLKKSSKSLWFQRSRPSNGLWLFYLFFLGAMRSSRITLSVRM